MQRPLFGRWLDMGRRAVLRPLPSPVIAPRILKLGAVQTELHPVLRTVLRTVLRAVLRAVLHRVTPCYAVLRRVTTLLRTPSHWQPLATNPSHSRPLLAAFINFLADSKRF